MKKTFLIHKLRQRINFENNYHKQKVVFIVPAGIIKGTVTLPRDYDDSVQYDNDGYTHMQDILNSVCREGYKNIDKVSTQYVPFFNEHEVIVLEDVEFSSGSKTIHLNSLLLFPEEIIAISIVPADKKI